MKHLILFNRAEMLSMRVNATCQYGDNEGRPRQTGERNSPYLETQCLAYSSRYKAVHEQAGRYFIHRPPEQTVASSGSPQLPCKQRIPLPQGSRLISEADAPEALEIPRQAV